MPDNYTITYEDNDIERVPYANMKRIVPGTPEYIEHQSIINALHVAFIAAAKEASRNGKSSQTWLLDDNSSELSTSKYSCHGHSMDVSQKARRKRYLHQESLSTCRQRIYPNPRRQLFRILLTSGFIRNHSNSVCPHCSTNVQSVPV